MDLLTFDNSIEALCTARPSKECKSPYVADVEYEGRSYIAHSPALGMGGYIAKDKKVLVTSIENPKGACSHKIVAAFDEVHNVWVGANPLHANTIFKKGCEMNIFPHFKDLTSIKTEVTHGDSRVDFFLNNDTFVEIKSVLVRENEAAIFPVGNKKNGTISERANKHISHLRSITQKFNTYIVFIVLRDDVECFRPNKSKDPIFYELLHDAFKNGVNIVAYQFKVTPTQIEYCKEIPVVF